MLFVVFNGFLIPRSEIPSPLIWIYYISPFSWGLQSVALNEFGSSRYDRVDPSNASRTIGESYLDSFGMCTTREWMWASLGYLWGFYWILTAISTGILARSRPIYALGTTERKSNKHGGEQHELAAEAAEVGTQAGEGHQSTSLLPVTGSTQPSAFSSSIPSPSPLSATTSFFLPFAPSRLSWHGISYSISATGAAGGSKSLLTNASGFADPDAGISR
jgi:hypothetical protein